MNRIRIEEINPRFFKCFILSILSIPVNYSPAAVASAKAAVRLRARRESVKLAPPPAVLRRGRRTFPTETFQKHTEKANDAT